MSPETPPKIDDVFFLVQIFCTFAMTGIIWFVQIVHYPLIRKVGKGRFARYVKMHLILTAFVVGPLMLLEAAAVIFGLLYATPWITDGAARFGAVLLLIIWISTFAIHLPQQRTRARIRSGRVSPHAFRQLDPLLRMELPVHRARVQHAASVYEIIRNPQLRIGGGAGFLTLKGAGSIVAC